MANTSAIWQQAADTTYHYLLAAEQEPRKKPNPQIKKCSHVRLHFFKFILNQPHPPVMPQETHLDHFWAVRIWVWPMYG